MLRFPGSQGEICVSLPTKLQIESESSLTDSINPGRDFLSPEFRGGPLRLKIFATVQAVSQPISSMKRLKENDASRRSKNESIQR
jgi:hypothetical protein